MAEYEDRTTRTTTTSADPYERTTTTSADPYERTTTTTADPYDRSTRTATYVERPREVHEEDRTVRHHHTVGHKNILDWLALILLIVGGLNWGLVGLFGIDVVASIFGPGSTLSRIIYIAVGVAAIWGFALSRLGPTRRV
ncbi:DUF378 domain-containing protein [Ramlibacter sp. MMS24-I3-19]|uniref:DUF378 domain-containing protein n=1 Tax=Ramlibacter sp. MMS24-I3-19 TaxID=3416606 RepID=UPI003D034EE3